MEENDHMSEGVLVGLAYDNRSVVLELVCPVGGDEVVISAAKEVSSDGRWAPRRWQAVSPLASRHLPADRGIGAVGRRPLNETSACEARPSCPATSGST
jgi:hypothetical protein